ncbi:hypothetical protein FO519_005571 [Halicephalobus sp. NKZ332]|nr:hypothetical protein FO519_005571 [Halicephalobus sp. NKZ332]
MLRFLSPTGLVANFWKSIILFICFNAILGNSTRKLSEYPRYSGSLEYSRFFPLYGAVFLPHLEFESSLGTNVTSGKFLANLEAVRPILDVAIADAHARYLKGWIPKQPNWLDIFESPVKECEDQKTAAWAALEAVRWTNGSGLDISFGPGCDYPLATVHRILTFYGVPMFTNAGFSEFFQEKPQRLLTRVGPLQDHITMMLDHLTKQFAWKKSLIMYEKSFWESELHEAGFCKILMNGIYLWTVHRKWDVQVTPKLLDPFWDNQNSREVLKQLLMDSVGVNHGAATREASKAWRHAGRREIWPLAVSESEASLEDLDDLDTPTVIAPSRAPRQLSSTKWPLYEVSKRKPVYILFPLPKEAGIKEHNPFGITIDLAKPVVDEAVDEVYRRQLVPEGSLEIAFEDTKLSDAHGPNVAIHALVKNKLDCIIGYAFVYSLAPVARMSPHWQDSDSHGIPVITSIGLTANLDNRQEYQLMTRISSPYKVVKDAVIALWREFRWSRSVYIFHDRRHGMTKPDIPYGECYLMMASLEPYLSKCSANFITRKKIEKNI